MGDSSSCTSSTPSTGIPRPSGGGGTPGGMIRPMRRGRCRGSMSRADAAGGAPGPDPATSVGTGERLRGAAAAGPLRARARGAAAGAVWGRATMRRPPLETLRTRGVRRWRVRALGWRWCGVHTESGRVAMCWKARGRKSKVPKTAACMSPRKAA